MEDPQSQNSKSKTLGISGQIALLFKKNLVTKLRQDKIKLASEILLPAFYLAILCYLVTLEKIKTYEPVTTSLEEPANVLESFSHTSSDFLTVHVAPNNPKIIQFTKTMNQVLQLYNGTNESEPPELIFKYYDSEEELTAYYNSPNSKLQMAVIFHENITTQNGFNYVIRLNPDNVFKLPLISTKKAGLETCRDYGPSQRTLLTPEACPVNGYFYSNFLALQFLVDQAYLKMKSLTPLHIAVTVENYPAAEYVAGLSTYLRVIIPIYSVLPLILLINNLLLLIVTEKEKKIKDGLRMVGVYDFAYWISWVGVYSIISFIFAVMFTIVMHFMNVLRNFNPFLLFLIFFIFGLSIITFAFMLTPFFHKPKTAGLVGSLIMQFTSFLFLIQTFVVGSSNIVLNAIKLISPVAFTTAIDEACAHEYTGGISWSDLVPGGKGQPILFSLLFLIFDTGLYMLVAIYLDNIIPNEFGVRKNPFYCFLPRSTRRSPLSRVVRSSSVNRSFDGCNETPNEDVEPVDQTLLGKEAIRIRHVRKTYNTSWTGKNQVEAVKGVSMNIYDGQITAILGKNGAGKTTLFNILIGLISPTSGTASVFGYDISDSNDMNCLRKMTGICLQSDLHFDALTVYEHLEFYGKLRGLIGVELKDEVESILQDLKLTEKRDMPSSKLSGGQKRKLSVGIALIGDPKIILLDEPTASMDPVSRRQLWGLLQRKKEGKVILLTTHFMDEADSLADRKAIIHDGVLKCLGSSLFLKQKFGVGYYLTIELSDRNCSSGPCDKIISKWLPEALLSKKVIGNEVKYSLPLADVLKFSEMFADIEENIYLSKDGLCSYGVSMTTLEEVFLKISTDSEAVPSFPHHSENQTQDNTQINIMDREYNLIPNESEVSRRSCRIILWMCYLRILRLIRSPQSCFFILVMPVLLVAIGLIIVKQSANKFADTSLHASKLADIYSNELNIAINEDSNEAALSTFFKDSGFNVVLFNGSFSSLLNINQPQGTMAAISVEQVVRRGAMYVSFRLMINGTFVHSPPSLVSMISQYIERQVLKSNVEDIDVISKPFTSKFLAHFDESSVYAVFLLAPAFVFVAVAIVLEIVSDREIKARNHLRVNGLSFTEYFSSLFTVYGVLALILTCLQLSLIRIFNVEAYLNVYAFTATTILLILFILPSLLFSVAFSYVFDKLETAQNIFSQVVSWSAMILSFIIIILDAVNPGKNVTIIVHGVFCALDVFYIPFGVFYFVNKQYLKCTAMDNCDILSWNDYMGTEFVVMFSAMLIQIPVFTTFILIADVIKNGGSLGDLFGVLRKSKSSTSLRRRSSVVEEEVSPSSPISNFSMDEDVLIEKEHVAELLDGTITDQDCVVAVKELEKQYLIKETDDDGSKKKALKSVVKDVNFSIKKGEVFGLLGHNGAGKTTVLRLITAEESPDFGSIQLCGYNIKSNVSDAFQSLGYCPQHDALWENITLKEHIKLYSVIRGISEAEYSSLTKEILSGLRIREHAKKKCRELSGGTKRKLSYALSVLGAPKVVFMDEPSTGMDPQSKRFLWNTVLGTFKESRGALLTTHSMEEADILCTKIAIMVKGSIICIGSPQHLKSKYGSGFTLEVRLSTASPAYFDYHAQSSDNAELSWIQPSTSAKTKRDGNFTFTYVKEHFPEARLTESNGNRAVFSVPRRTIKSISETFALLEKLKKHGDIEEYSFSQTTLEQVFLSFAKEDEEQE